MWFPVISLRLVKSYECWIFFPTSLIHATTIGGCIWAEMRDHSCLGSAFPTVFLLEHLTSHLSFFSLDTKRYLSLLRFVKKKKKKNKWKRTKKWGWFSIQKTKSSDKQYVEVPYCYCRLSSSVIATGYQSVQMRTFSLTSRIILLNWKHRHCSTFVDLNYQILALCVHYFFLTYRL